MSGLSSRRSRAASISPKQRSALNDRSWAAARRALGRIASRPALRFAPESTPPTTRAVAASDSARAGDGFNTVVGTRKRVNSLNARLAEAGGRAETPQASGTCPRHAAAAELSGFPRRKRRRCPAALPRAPFLEFPNG